MPIRLGVRRKIAIALVFCVAFIVICNVYLIGLIQSRQHKPSFPSNKITFVNDVTTKCPSISASVIRKIGRLHDNKNASFLHHIWVKARKWVTPQQVYPLKQNDNNLEMEEILSAMLSAPITRVSTGRGGTQLKVTLTFLGNQKAVFKPMRYHRDKVFNDTPYAGADRHNGEIAAFHLSRILNIRRSPLVVGRQIDLSREVLPVADSDLLKTFQLNGNNTCFYGICYYCRAEDLVCANGDMLEGAVILWLPGVYKLKAFKHPWRRTYRKGVTAAWESSSTFCETVQRSKIYSSANNRLLELVETAIFDFLIGNADRHRYEVFETFANGSVLLFDNGKSFGNPYVDEVSILAPLYQCCVIRKNLWTRLHLFTNSSLSSTLDESLASDPLAPILTPLHLQAMDRRLQKVLEFGQMCISRHGYDKVFH